MRVHVQLPKPMVRQTASVYGRYVRSSAGWRQPDAARLVDSTYGAALGEQKTDDTNKRRWRRKLR